MKKAIFIFLASSAFAALPPLAQSIREIEALLADPKFYHSLGSAERIEEIIRTESGFLVVTQNYTMQVDVKYDQREGKMIGPVPFHLEFQSPVFNRL